MSITPDLIQQVWEKGTPVLGQDPNLWRLDSIGRLIYRFAHGDRWSMYGWEVDHIIPVAKGGSDYPWNLQPLHWRENAAKQDNLLQALVQLSRPATLASGDPLFRALMNQ